MPSLRRLIGPIKRSLAEHLDRLRQTLDTLRVRLKDAVVRAVGETVGNAVREAMRAVFTDEDVHRDLPEYPVRSSSYRPSPMWDEPEESPWYERPDEPTSYEEDNQPDWQDEPPEPAKPPTRRWIQALAVGFEVAAWWLRQQGGHFPIILALGFGLVSALVARTAGSAAVAAAGLLGSVVSLALLARSVRSSVAGLSLLAGS